MIQKNLLQKKKAQHTPSGYSLVTCCSFDKSKNERNFSEEKTVWKGFVKI